MDKVAHTTTQFYPERTLDSEQRINLKNFDESYTAGLFIGAINIERQRRFRSKLEQDSLLNQIAIASITTFSKKTFIHSRTWYKEKRGIKFALQQQQSKNKIYSAHAFLFDVLDLQFSSPFYCDKRNGNSSIHLYKGRKPDIINPNDMDYIEPKALEPITESQLGERLIALFSGSGFSKDLLSKKYSRIGLALKLDKNSLDRNTRPKVFVILIFGGKQLQSLKVPKELADENYNNIADD